MFTGIVEATARVLQSGGGRLAVARPAAFSDLRVGSSVSVAGVCLTVAEMDERALRFDVVEETLAKSRLGELKEGDAVNLERAMSASSRLDGHVVQGHAEGTGEVLEFRDARLRVRIPRELLPFVAPKGSIAIDGVSLTVAAIEGDVVEIALVPHTLRTTTLSALGAGDRVNIETDILARTAARR